MSGHPSITTRRLAALAFGATALGATLLTWATITTPGFTPDAYLSELGIPGAPSRGVFLAAMFLLALGVGALAAPLARIHHGTGITSPLILLGFGGVLLTQVAVFPCSARCPLPPHGDDITTTDLLHGFSATTASLATLATMISSARFAVDPFIRQFSLVAAAITFAAGSVEIGAIALQARGLTNGVSERILVTTSALWILVVAYRLAKSTAPHPASTARSVAHTASN